MTNFNNSANSEFYKINLNYVSIYALMHNVSLSIKHNLIATGSYSEDLYNEIMETLKIEVNSCKGYLSLYNFYGLFPMLDIATVHNELVKLIINDPMFNSLHECNIRELVYKIDFLYGINVIMYEHEPSAPYGTRVDMVDKNMNKISKIIDRSLIPNDFRCVVIEMLLELLTTYY